MFKAMYTWLTNKFRKAVTDTFVMPCNNKYKPKTKRDDNPAAQRRRVKAQIKTRAADTYYSVRNRGDLS